MKGVLKMKQVTKQDTKRLLSNLAETYEVVNYERGKTVQEIVIKPMVLAMVQDIKGLTPEFVVPNDYMIEYIIMDENMLAMWINYCHVEISNGNVKKARELFYRVIKQENEQQAKRYYKEKAIERLALMLDTFEETHKKIEVFFKGYELENFNYSTQEWIALEKEVRKELPNYVVRIIGEDTKKCGIYPMDTKLWKLFDVFYNSDWGGLIALANRHHTRGYLKEDLRKVLRSGDREVLKDYIIHLRTEQETEETLTKLENVIKILNKYIDGVEKEYKADIEKGKLLTRK